MKNAMGKYGEQIDKGKLGKHVTPGQKKANKKIHKRTVRRTKITETPMPKKYSGWCV